MAGAWGRQRWTGRFAAALLGVVLLISVLAPRPVAAASSIPSGGLLATGQSLSSPSGIWTLAMQTDGNLVLYQAGVARWALHTFGDGHYLQVHDDGNLILHSTGGRLVWLTATAGNPGAELRVQDDGNVVLYGTGRALWDRMGTAGANPQWAGRLSNGLLRPGQSLPSPNGRYELVMQTDGNLVLYHTGVAAVWASRTASAGNAGSTLHVQPDGNMVIYGPSGTPTWFTRTSAGAGTVLLVQDDGNAVLYGPDGRVQWDAWGTSGHRAGVVRDPLVGVAGYLAGRAARVSVAVWDHNTGYLYSYRVGDTYYSASIGKVNVMQAVFNRGATAYQRSRMVPMIQVSDNAAATELFQSIGGTPALQAYDNRIGLSHTTVAGWGLARTSADDQVTLVSKMAFGGPFPEADRAYGLQLMHTVTPSQFWGVSAGTQGAYVALKNGWLPYQGSWHVNSIGYVDGPYQRYSVAVLTQGAPSMDSAITTIEGVATRVYANLAP